MNKFQYAILATIVGVSGLALITIHSNWQTAFGVFLVAFAHNLEKH